MLSHILWPTYSKRVFRAVWQVLYNAEWALLENCSLTWASQIVAKHSWILSPKLQMKEKAEGLAPQTHQLEQAAWVMLILTQNQCAILGHWNSGFCTISLLWSVCKGIKMACHWQILIFRILVATARLAGGGFSVVLRQAENHVVRCWWSDHLGYCQSHPLQLPISHLETFIWNNALLSYNLSQSGISQCFACSADWLISTSLIIRQCSLQ